jgi:Flp pilus assembly protein TadD
MLPRPNNCLPAIFVCALTTTAVFSSGSGHSALRKMKLGDTMPEFSLPDSEGNVFTYEHDRKRVLAVVFLSASQKQSRGAAADIRETLADLRAKAEPFDLVGIMTGPATGDLLESTDSKPSFPILIDSQYKLWGKLGIIAMPTVLIIAKDDKASWIRAGYGYDFAPALRSNLSYALGIAGTDAPEDGVKAEALANNTTASRVKRHLRMAKILQTKGRFDSAIAEVRKAQALDPNGLEPVLELGELFCRAGKGKDALENVRTVEASARPDKARLLLISGWARRLIGDLERAQKDLLDATRLDPKSTRGHFELGQVYRAKGDKDKALEAYHRALTLLLGDS